MKPSASGRPRSGVAVVTGASSGIGAATARSLAGEGFDVVLGARREDRLSEVVEEITKAGGVARAFPLDVTDAPSVDRFCAAVEDCRLLVNNAGGAVGGMMSVAEADDDAYRWMFEANVLGTVRMTRALLPRLLASGDGHVINVGSVAAFEAYPGGGGYNAAKFALRAVTSALRQELLGQPVRVTEIDPGMVETEFSLVRFGGDADRAARVYQGVTPLTPDDVAACISFAATRPPHVNIDQIVVLARDQASAKQVYRRDP